MEGSVWDPLRRKEVPLTPEEKVRHWFIGYLRDAVRVPAGLMISETAIQLGAKRYRVDILVYDRKGAPLAVVECKKPEVELDGMVLDQAVRYNMVLNVKYIIITNGRKTCVCRREEGSMEYKFLNAVPTYEEMVGG